MQMDRRAYPCPGGPPSPGRGIATLSGRRGSAAHRPLRQRADEAAFLCPRGLQTGVVCRRWRSAGGSDLQAVAFSDGDSGVQHYEVETSSKAAAMASGTSCPATSAAERIMRSTARGEELPWPTSTLPSTPSSGTPPRAS